jgi:hypothetical protein
MNNKEREQAIRSFVKDKFEFLLSKSFARQKLRHEFHGRHGNKFGKLEPKDIVIPLVNLLKDTQVSPQNIKQYLETLPVFKNINSGLLLQLRQIANERDFASGLKDEDLEMIKKLSAVDAAKDWGVVKLGVERSRTLEELDKKIQHKQSEYESLPSVLDYEEIPEPEFDPQYEETQQWWERFCLTSDPFRLKEGLQQIDENLYEEITVKTKPFQDMLTALDKNPGHLFHAGFLLVGDFGYGKTTFIDYLRYVLVQKNILPILITPGSRDFPDSSSYAIGFHLSLRDKLKEQLVRISTEGIPDLSSMDVENQIRELLSRIQKHRRAGVVVFMDDYHKHEKSYEYIFAFLGLQQILKNDLMRADLNVGFIVSGVPQWNEALSRSSQLRGFLDGTPIVMPEITPDLVCEVFNQRIKAYCVDASPLKIKPEFVKRMFDELKVRRGYRDYLIDIITQLSNNNFAIIDAPVEISQKTLREIKNDLEQRETLRVSLNKLVQTSRFKRHTKEQIAKSLGLLVQTSIHDGVAEADRLFQQNAFYFKLLHDSGLIQKRRTGTNTTLPFVWVIHERLQTLVDVIREKYKLGINDYLLKIYAGKEYAAQAIAATSQSSELADVVKFFSREDLSISKEAREHISMALRLFDSILSRASIKPSADDVDRGWTAFTSLSSGFFEIDGSKAFFKNAAILDLKDQWHFHWSDDEVLSELLNRYHDYTSKEGSEKSICGSLVLKQLQDVFPLFVNRLMSFTRDLSDDAFKGLFSRNVQHSAEELTIFVQASESYTSTVNMDHYNYVKRITEYLETRMRLFLYATSVMSFGDSYEAHIPAPVHDYARRNIDSRPSGTPFSNTFNGLTRAQLRTIFLDKNQIKETICKYIDCGWTDDDWKMFFNAFVDWSIATGHQRLELFSPADSNKYINYCRRAEELTCGMNTFIRQIVKNSVYLILCGDEDNDPTNYFFKFIFKPDSRGDLSGRRFTYKDVPKPLATARAVAEGTLKEDAYRMVVTSLKHKIEGSPRNCLVEDLLDVEYLASNYNVTYLEFIQSLAFAYWQAHDVVVQPWFGSSVLIKRAVS